MFEFVTHKHDSRIFSGRVVAFFGSRLVESFGFSFTVFQSEHLGLTLSLGFVISEINTCDLCWLFWTTASCFVKVPDSSNN